jgi:G:T/U-mismatch repair DNA glycosylase
MDFFYPNKINDFWRVMGIIFMGNRDALWDSELQRFDLFAIQALLRREGIALWDTAMAVRRLRDNASDKFLEIVEPINLAALLDKHPTISHIITTGEKATSVIATQAGIDIPAIGTPVDCNVGGHSFVLWRTPSTSRAYPMALDKKADAYRRVFEYQ